MDTRKERWWLLAAVAFAVCLTVYMLGSFVTHPGTSSAVMGGDAGKNYLSYFWHSLYDNGGVWYHGMNYPYGEHIMYADGQALLTIPLSYLNQWLHFSRETVLAIMNLFIALGYVVGVVYVYKTLVYYRVAHWASIIFAGLIISLSPQVMRFEIHFALANMCFLPMLFYWFARYYNEGRARHMLYAFLLGGTMSFLHPYFGALLSIWILLYLLGCWVLQRGNVAQKLRHSLAPVLCLVGVYGIITLFMKFTDPVTDRPVYPYGALQTVTTPSLILTSARSPFWKFITAHTGSEFGDTAGEGYIYIGLAAVLVCCIAVVISIIRLIRKKKGASGTAFPAIWLWVALGALLLATGIPFIWKESLYEHMSVMRQFRALGRFGWIFYYIITIFAAVKIWEWHAAVKSRSNGWAYAILLLPMLVWAAESNAYIRLTRNAAKGAHSNYTWLFQPQAESWTGFLEQHDYKGSDMQGIVLLPFINIGSEKLWTHEMEGWVVSLGSRAALQLQLPIVNVMMSRSSLSLAERQVRLVGGPFTDKPLLRDMYSNKPFLILHLKSDPLDLDQQYLLTASTYLGDFSDCHVYAFHPEKLLAGDKQYRDSVMSIAASMRHAGDTCIHPTGSWYTNHFDSGAATQKLAGKGAAQPFAGDGQQYVAKMPVKTADTSEWYECSLWVLVQAKDYRSPEFDLQIVDSTGKQIGAAYMNAKESVDNNGLWLRTSCYFELPANAGGVWCRQVAYKYPCYFALDELLLRPASSLVISKSTDGKVMANGHVVR